MKDVNTPLKDVVLSEIQIQGLWITRRRVFKPLPDPPRAESHNNMGENKKKQKTTKNM